MPIEDRLHEDLKAAMKAGDEDRKGTLRMVLAALHNEQIERRAPLDEAAEEAVLRRQAKQRRDAIELYERGGRPELAARERVELDIINGYLPPSLDEAAIEAAARAQIAAVGATSLADMGKVMPPLRQQLAGQADGQVMAAVVRRLLAG
jgi:uncharacterized protein